jgi:exopolysaccharide biosynthesis polyprenyl glycosylphosphotransferase
MSPPNRPQARLRPAQSARRPALRLHTLVMSCAALVDAMVLIVLLIEAASAGSSPLLHSAGQGRALVVALGLTVSFACTSRFLLYNAKSFMSWRAACRSAFWPFAAGIAAVVLALWDTGTPARDIAAAAMPPFSAGLLFIGISRSAWQRLLRFGIMTGALSYQLVVIGTECDAVAAELRQLSSPFIQIQALPHHEESLRTAAAWARRQFLDGIILAYGPFEADFMASTFEALKPSLPDILFYSRIARCGALPESHPLSDYPVAPIQRAALRERDIFVKGTMDRLGSLALILLMLPLLVATAIAIRLESSGPIFFVQPRVGYNNRIFMMFKFRSMYHDQRDSRARAQTIRNDRRVTRVGRFIRRWSIDELPQLFNVLLGDMSLVGPRPHAPGTNVGGVLLTQAIEEYPLRHRVPPGITGWAQVNGSRGVLMKAEDIARRVSLDLYYIEHWSLMLDLKILLLTAVRAAKTNEAF